MRARVVPPGFTALSPAARRQVGQQGGRANAGKRRVALVKVHGALAKLALAAHYAAEAYAEFAAAFAPLESQPSAGAVDPHVRESAARPRATDRMAR